MSTSLRILIVDDSRSMRIIAKSLVTSLGHEVVADAEDGKVALKRYVELKPDVVLLDLVMPRFDGKKTLTKLIQLDPLANIIICSSLGSQGDIEFCLREGAKFYLQKPYEIEGIKNAFASLPLPTEQQA
ncbi:MAG: response regulator [Gammaproteobacteria bacterium]|nr:response regulator [Gammaproteobacteria bacterium]